MLIQQPDDLGKVGYGTGVSRLGDHCLVGFVSLVFADAGVYVVVPKMQDAKA